MSMAEVKFALDTSFIRRVNKNLQEKGGGEGGEGKRGRGADLVYWPSNFPLRVYMYLLS